VKVIESERISTLMWDKSNYTAFIPEAGSDFDHVDTLKINQTTSNWSDSRGQEKAKGPFCTDFTTHKTLVLSKFKAIFDQRNKMKPSIGY
jgi:hypothetical protein